MVQATLPDGTLVNQDNIEVVSVVFAPTAFTVAMGTSGTLNATITPFDAPITFETTEDQENAQNQAQIPLIATVSSTACETGATLSVTGVTPGNTSVLAIINNQPIAIAAAPVKVVDSSISVSKNYLLADGAVPAR